MQGTRTPSFNMMQSVLSIATLAPIPRKKGKGMFHGIFCYSGKMGGGGGSTHVSSNNVLPGATYFCMVAAHF